MAVPRSFLSGINLSGVLQLSSTPGTSGQVLTSQGAGNTPIWTTPGTFGYLGNTQTTASASATISLTVPSISSGTGNAISITAGTTTAANGIGGAVTITGGTVSNLSSITTGGSVNINGGTASSSGSGVGGFVNIDGGIGGGNGNGSVQIGTGAGSDAVTIGKSTGVITINGSTITLGTVPTLPSQTANTFFAAPTGSAGTPTFRTLQTGDISTTSPPSTYGQAITYAPVGNGMVWTGPYLATSGGSFSAGTITVAPVKFTSGTNLTTPAAGAVEYNGDIFTLTNSGTATGRNMIQANAWAFSNANSSAATTTTPVSIFQTGARALTLEPAKTYYFKLNLGFIATFTSGTATIQLVPTFSNAPVSINYTALYIPGTAGSSQAYRISSTAATAISPAITATQTNAGVIVEGYFQSNATTGGTVEFKFQMSTTGTSTVVINGSYQQITKIGTGVPAVVSGAWA